MTNEKSLSKDERIDMSLLELIREGFVETFMVDGEERFRLTPKGLDYANKRGKKVEMTSKNCEHDFQPIKRFLMPKGYSKCSKCGLLRHDKDGHTFRTTGDGYRSASK